MLFAEPARPQPAGGRLRRFTSLGFSLCVHGGILAWVALGPTAREDRRSLYEQVIQPNEKRIVWYNLRERLPEVTPTETREDIRPPRATVIHPQTIVSQGVRKGEQMIFLPEAPPVEAPEVKSPNVLAMSKPVRQFDAPKPQPPTPKPAPALPDAPQVQQPAPAAVPMPAPKPLVRAFTPPPQQTTPARTASLPTAPELAVAMDPKIPRAALIPAAPLRPAPRTFIPPVEAARGPERPAPALPAAPEVAGTGTGTAAAVAGLPVPARPLRPFNAPAGSAATAQRAGEALPAAPELSASTNGASTLAIVGLRPTGGLEVPAPPGARSAEFAAGPKLSLGGGTGGANKDAQISVPGLLVRNGPKDAQPTLIAQALQAPTSAANLAAAARTIPRAPASPEPEAPTPGAVRVAGAPDPRLEGRLVYSIAVQMPNITSYSGSWILWFAERQPQPGQPPTMSSPVPLRKVDPKYPPSAIDDRVQGTVRLAAVIRRDGRVDEVAVIRGLDERIDPNALAALQKWEFQPARRNGTPVDVDVVVDIPFRLAPPPARK